MSSVILQLFSWLQAPLNSAIPEAQEEGEGGRERDGACEHLCVYV